MHQKSKDIQLQYEGFIKTPCLWKSDAVYSLHQFDIEQNIRSFDKEIDTKLRLGKYIERFVSFQLSQVSNIEIIAENLQIQEGKQTVGELDCLLLQQGKPIHLEIIYKFYLYEQHANNNELYNWIGPNRKDSLVEKLEKLTHKQLPILHTTSCKGYLENLTLDPSQIKQQIYFKAQLFVPLNASLVNFSALNSDCIAGCYIRTNELHQFKDYKFYIPSKKDWLTAPHTSVNWLSYRDFLIESASYLQRQFSPLCWIKSNKGILKKCFLVWWE